MMLGFQFSSTGKQETNRPLDEYGVTERHKMNDIHVRARVNVTIQAQFTAIMNQHKFLYLGVAKIR